MTLDEVNDKLDRVKNTLEGLQTRLENMIGTSKKAGDFDYKGKDPLGKDANKEELEHLLNVIEDIWKDEIVKAILKDEGNEFKEKRKEYIEVMKLAIKNTVEALTGYKGRRTGDSEEELDRIQEIIDSVDKNNQKVKTLETFEKIDKDDLSFIVSDKDRETELEEMVEKLDNAKSIALEFDKVKKDLTPSPTSLDDAIDKSIAVAKDFITKIEIFKKSEKKIESLRVYNLPEMLKVYNSNSEKDGFNFKAKENQEYLNDIKTVVEMLVDVDGLDDEDKSSELLELKNSIPKNFKDKTDVENWIQKLNDAVSNEDISGKIIKDSTEYEEFLNSRKEHIRKKFLDELKKSPVHKNLYGKDFDNDILKLDFDSEEMEKYLKNTKKALEDYQSSKYKEPTALEGYINKAKTLLESYRITAKSSSSVTFNGKTLTFTDIDMTDESQTKDARAYLTAVSDDDPFKKEFKKEVKKEVTALVGPKPTDRWYHRLLNVVSLGRYQTPEQKYDKKYDEIYYKKEEEKLIGVITKNKTERKDAQEKVADDKNYLNKIARENLIKEPTKKLNKKEIRAKRNNEFLR